MGLTHELFPTSVESRSHAAIMQKASSCGSALTDVSCIMVYYGETQVRKHLGLDRIEDEDVVLKVNQTLWIPDTPLFIY